MPGKTLIRPLTSLRFFAAIMVVAHHFGWFTAGYAGVGFFFVLSGYVLALNYEGKVSTRDERKSFWWKRFARIYPTYLLTFLLALPLGFPFHALPSFFLIQSWIPSSGIFFGGNVPAWSIANEAFFYALFPLLLGFRWQTLALWGAGLFLVATAWPTSWPNHWLFYVFPPTRLFEFALGIALARLRGTANGVHEAGALVLAIASVFALPLFNLSVGWAVFFIPAAAALVYVFSRSTGPVAKLLSTPSLVLLGDASFALYMIHWLLMMYLGKGIEIAALAVTLSVVMYLYFEKPSQAFLLRRLSGRARGIEPGARSTA